MDTCQKPFVRQWDGHDHAHFIRWAYEHFRTHAPYNYRSYREHTGFYQKRIAEARLAALSKLYRVGKRLKLLDCDYLTFDRKMGDPHSWRGHSPGQYRFRVYSRPDNYDNYYPKDGAHYRQKTPLSITEKKVLTEEMQQKQEWRRSKKRLQDGFKNNHKTYAKRMSNRSYRRHANSQVRSGDWENSWKTQPKHYFDPWDWD